MPKDEIDPEDPLELHGIALLTGEDTTDAMAECIIEEFLRLGHGPEQILALFQNRHYTGPNMVLQNRGEAYVLEKIREVFGWWGYSPTTQGAPAVPAGTPTQDPSRSATPLPDRPCPVQSVEFEPGLTDPGGAAIPRLLL